MIYAKIQSYRGEEFHVQQMPIQLINGPSVQGLRIMNCPKYPKVLGVISWNSTSESYSLEPQVEVIINDQITQEEVNLDNLSRIYWPCDCVNKNFFHFILPLKEPLSYKQQIPKTKINTELILPSQINGSLKLLSVGRIIPTIYYHSEHNLFPVGYKSVRQYASMFTRGKRCNYTCEIFEGQDGKPIFKVQSEEDPENPIIKSSCTGCWVYICNRVNDLQEHKKTKVTISGTDRFGLLEPNVQRHLEELPGAELCVNYKFKYRTQLMNY